MNLRTCLMLSLLLLAAGCVENRQSFYQRIQPVPKESGFKMDDWFVWGGSCVEVDGTYHLFASRWPEETGFPQGYRTHSEIVRATADNPLGPYEFQEVVIGAREAGYWDAGMAHNPTIHRIGDRFVLFYNGSDEDSRYRQIGYAWAESITGPWNRSDQPLDFNSDANNPAVFVEPDGSIKMMWRNRELQVFVATAPQFEGTYTIENEDAFPRTRLEDFYLFKKNNMYHMVCEDNRGEVSGHERWGVHFVSQDGIHNWRKHEPVVFYDHTVHFTDGDSIHCERRERPQLLIDQQGEVTHLFTSVLFEGETWCQVVPLRN